MNRSPLDMTSPMAWARIVRTQRNTMPGLYPMFLYMLDGAVLCADCVRENFSEISGAIRGGSEDQWYPVGMSSCAEVEPDSLTCAHCGNGCATW